MKAVIVNEADKSLSWEECPTPQAGNSEVLVRIHAAGQNRADLSQRIGRYPPPPGVTDIMGLEAAGEVVGLGEGVDSSWLGKRVCFLLAGGGYATHCVVDHRMLMMMADEWDYSYAAGIPEVFITAFLNVFLEAGLGQGESLLVHAGASGVGTAAIQMANAAGNKVFATAGTAEKCELCRSLGATKAINYKESDFLEELGENSVDVVFDMVGKDYYQSNILALKPRGRLVWISFLSGIDPTINIAQLMRKNLRLIGSTLRARSLEEKINIVNQLKERFWPSLLSGEIKPIIDSTFKITEVESSHAFMKENKNAGKIILEIPSEDD